MTLTEIAPRSLVRPLPATMGSAPSCDAATVEASTKVNRAFVFIKPHASNDAVEAVVKAKFGEKGIKILGQGVLGGAEIDESPFVSMRF